MTRPREELEELTIVGLIDWTDATWLWGSAGGKSSAEIRWSTFGLISEAVPEGLVVMGDTNDAGEFVVWEGECEDWLRRLIASWPEDFDPWPPGKLGWLQNTEAGNRFARDAIRDRDASGRTQSIGEGPEHDQ